MTAAKKFLIVVSLISLGAAGAFAAGQAQTTPGGYDANTLSWTVGTYGADTAVLPQQIALPAAAKKIFVDAGIPAANLDKPLEQLTADERDAINAVYDDNADALDALVRTNLAAALAPGKCEYAYSVAGNRKWILAVE